MVTAQHVADGGGRDDHAELAVLAHDPEVAPAPVLAGQAQDEGDDLFVEGVECCAVTAWEGPGPGHQVSVLLATGLPASLERCPSAPG
jgi:hypothetical protein